MAATIFITGAEGNDVLFGHDGNDSLNGSVGNDVLEGGIGSDWAIFDYRAHRRCGGRPERRDPEHRRAGIDTLRDIENVQATGSHGDSLTGNNVANELRGEGGNDWMWGNGGNDIVNGGAGDDAIAGGTGMDQMIGGRRQRSHLGRQATRDTFVLASGWATTGSGTIRPDTTRSTSRTVGFVEQPDPARHRGHG